MRHACEEQSADQVIDSEGILEFLQLLDDRLRAAHQEAISADLPQIGHWRSVLFSDEGMGPLPTPIFIAIVNQQVLFRHFEGFFVAVGDNDFAR